MLIFVAAPVCAQAQRTPATKADVQNVFKIITEDPAKIQAFCDIGKIGDEMEQANAKRDSKKVEELSLKADELGKQLGPEYAALVDGLQDIDPQSEVGREISSTLDALDNLCAG
jgi:mevalonate kinase